MRRSLVAEGWGTLESLCVARRATARNRGNSRIGCPYRWVNRLITRRNHNDGYSHVNNAICHSFFDITITRMMLAITGFDMQRSEAIGLVVEGGCRYFTPRAFPDEVNAGRVSAQGHFVHVMVDRSNNRRAPIPKELRATLETLMLPG